MRVSALRGWSFRDRSTDGDERADGVSGELQQPAPVRRGPGAIRVRLPHGVVPRAARADQSGDGAWAEDRTWRRVAMPTGAVVRMLAA